MSVTLLTPLVTRRLSASSRYPSVSQLCRWVNTTNKDLEVATAGRGRYLAYSQQQAYREQRPVNRAATGLLQRHHGVDISIHGTAVVFDSK